MKNKIIFSVIAVILIGVSFYAGTLFGQSVNSNQRPMNGDGQFNGRGNGQMSGQTARAKLGSMINGEIVAMDEKTLTLKTRDNSTKNIYFADTTKVYKQVEGQLTDVVIGKTIMVSGNANQDGSMAASDIQIRPENLLNSTTTPPTNELPENK